MSLTARLAKRIEEISAEQETILNAASTEGAARDLTAEEATKFDALDAEKKGLKNQLNRAAAVEKDKAEAKEAARQPILQQPHAPANVAATGPKVFAQPRRHAKLEAFKGADAAERAEAVGMWAAATLYANDQKNAAISAKARHWCQENGLFADYNATLTSTNNSGAGFFVPQVMDNAIIELAEQYGVFRRNADIQQMTSETWDGPRWIGGMTAYFVAQGNKPTSSDPAWDKVSLVARDLAALTKMTRQLNEDSIISLGDKIVMSLMLAFTDKEDDCGFNGTGASTYGGITGLIPKLGLSANAASVYTAATGNTTPDTLDLIDFTKCMGKLPQYPNIQPKWFCHKEVWAASMLPLALAAGGTRPSDVNGGQGTTFLGYPVEITQKMPALASVTAGTIGILFGDLKLSSKLGDRRGMTVESGFENDDFTKQLMTVMGTQRFDINNHTIVDPRDGSKAGPVIGLKTASS